MKISVIVPAHNEENRFREALESLVHQTIGLESLEIILVDDASGDSTPDIMKEYEQKYPESIMAIFCEENGRQGTARNIGMSYASGDWIAFMDADDQVHLRMFETLMSIAEKSDAEMITFKYATDEAILEADLNDADNDFRVMEILTEDERRDFVLRSDLINNSCTQKIYKRDLLARVGSAYAEGVCYEEPLFTYPLRYYVNRVALTEIPFYFYHLNPDGTINQTMSNPATILQHLQVQQKLLEFMRGKDVYTAFRDEIDLNFLHCFVYEPYLFLGGRGYEIPENVNAYIARCVNEKMPYWSENPYFPRIPEEEQEYIRSVLG